MGPSARTAAGLVAALLLLLPVSCSKEEASAGGELEIDLAKAVEAAEKRTPEDVEIAWYGSHLTKTRALKQLGRQMRNLDKAIPRKNFEKLTVLAIEEGDPELLATGYFGRAYLEAEKLLSGDTDPEKVVDMVLTAVELGYRNIREIRQAKVFRPLYDIPRFRRLIRELEAEQSAEIRESIRREIDEELRLGQEVVRGSWSPELLTLEGESIWREGQPMLVVVSRIHHDGFDKLSPLLHEVERDSLELPLAVVFYQYDKENPSRLSQTREYIRHLGLEMPVGVMGRREYLELMNVLEGRHDALRTAREGEKDLPFNPFQPLGLFLDVDRRPLYVTRGVLPEWQFRYVAGKFLEAVPPPPSVEAPEKPDETEKPERPAEVTLPEGESPARTEEREAEAVEGEAGDEPAEPKESEPVETPPEETEPEAPEPEAPEGEEPAEEEPETPEGEEPAEEEPEAPEGEEPAEEEPEAPEEPSGETG